MTMPIIRRMGEILFGLVSACIGVVSILEAVAMTLDGPRPANNSAGARAFMAIFVFVLCEMLCAFGLAALLLAVRCILGPRSWISRVLNSYWQKAALIALALPAAGMGIAVIGKLIEWFAR